VTVGFVVTAGSFVAASVSIVAIFFFTAASSCAVVLAGAGSAVVVAVVAAVERDERLLHAKRTRKSKTVAPKTCRFIVAKL